MSSSRPSPQPSVKPAASPTSAPTDSIPLVASKQCEPYSDTFDLCTDNGVPYYHCDRNKDKLGTDILLLHGASFSKENWRRKDIIDDLCQHVTVVASDLSVSANSNVLMSMLDRFEAAGVMRLPITVVTPSASGRSIVTWLQGVSSIDDMPKYVKTWVPVAPYSVLSATDAQLSALIEQDVEVLAINGDRDKSGGQVSERLGGLADAKVVVLDGGHAVYLSSPEEFAETVLETVLGVEL